LLPMMSCSAMISCSPDFAKSKSGLQNYGVTPQCRNSRPPTL
jgi:hypothetical protein